MGKKDKRIAALESVTIGLLAVLYVANYEYGDTKKIIDTFKKHKDCNSEVFRLIKRFEEAVL